MSVLVSHETLHVPVMYGSETMLWKEEKSMIRAVQMDNLRGLVGISRLDVPNAQIKQLCRVTKGVEEKIDEGVLRWFSHMERWRRKGLLRAYVGECAGSHSVGRLQKRWIDTVKECLRKWGFVVRQAMRMVQDRSEWRVFVRGSAWGIAQGMNPRP